MSHDRLTLRPKVVSTFSSQGKWQTQEDYVLADQEKGIFLVADGFGGAGPGFEAAKGACEAIRNFLFKEAGDLDATLPFILRNYFSLAGNVLFNSLIYANRKLAQMNRGKSLTEKGGASVLAAFLDGDLLAIANAGVCSAWLVREGSIQELIMSRSYGRLVNPFTKPIPEVLRVPMIALGMSEDLEPEIFEYRLQKGDWLILGTDGLEDFDFKRFSDIQLKRLTPEEAAREAVKSVGESSIQDNTSLSLAIF